MEKHGQNCDSQVKFAVLQKRMFYKEELNAGKNCKNCVGHIDVLEGAMQPTAAPALLSSHVWQAMSAALWKSLNIYIKIRWPKTV